MLNENEKPRPCRCGFFVRLDIKIGIDTYTVQHYTTYMDKTINLHEDFHEALMNVKNKTGAAVRFQVHIAIREYLERYHEDEIKTIKQKQGNELKK